MEEDAQNKRRYIKDNPSSIANATKDREFQSPIPKSSSKKQLVMIQQRT